METVTDAFLLQLASISASLLGFFVIGVFFYVQRGMFPQVAEHALRYLRNMTGSVILLYGMSLILAMSLVVLELERVAVVYALLSILLVWSVVRTSRAIRRLHQVLGLRIMSQLALWSAAMVVVAGPWVLGGSNPTRSQFAWSIAVVGLLAFASSAGLVLSTFDIARLEAATLIDEPVHPSPEVADPAKPIDGRLVATGPSEGDRGSLSGVDRWPGIQDPVP